MESEKLLDGSTVNVFSESELEGDEDICTQLLKLSEDNWIDPEQDVFEVLVVIEVLSIVSEKDTNMLILTEAPLWLSVGEIVFTVGADVSITNELMFNVTLLLELSVTVILQS